MGKYRLKKSTLLVSLLFIFGGCGYKFISGINRAVFLKPILNSSMQPGIDLSLSGELKNTLVQYPGFTISGKEADADCILEVNIKKWERFPLFFSTEGDDKIVIAKFRVETDISLSEPARKPFTKTIADTFSISLATEYKEDEVLRKISRKLAERIYFLLMERI